MKLFLVLLCILTCSVCQGQVLGEYFVSIPSDSTVARRIKFITDSTGELSRIPTHMSVQQKELFTYRVKDGLIEILPQKLTLKVIENGFISESNSTIYVRERDFSKNRDIRVIIDGKEYIQNVGETNSYGLVVKGARRNKKLHKRVNAILQNPDKYTIQTFKGLEAYKRYGYKGVYGVIVITSKT